MPDPKQEVEWAEVSPNFGSALPNGSCNAVIYDFLLAGAHARALCGYPRDRNGECTGPEKHGKPPEVEHG